MQRFELSPPLALEENLHGRKIVGMKFDATGLVMLTLFKRLLSRISGNRKPFLIFFAIVGE